MSATEYTGDTGRALAERFEHVTFFVCSLWIFSQEFLYIVAKPKTEKKEISNYIGPLSKYIDNC